MRVLFVAPMQRSSGEAATVLLMARALLEERCEVRVLASTELVPSLRSQLPAEVRALTSDRDDNVEAWQRTVTDFAPSHVVFADFPMLSFSSGAAPLWCPRWLGLLERSRARLLTLDHLAYGQRPTELYFGPPHLCRHPERIPEIPARMGCLLPCPIHEPGSVPGRRGAPFGVPMPPLPSRGDVRERVRARLGIEGGAMILHAVSAWAREFCRVFELGYYDVLGRVLGWYFEGAPQPVTLVSVNDGRTVAPTTTGAVRIINLDRVDADEFGELVASCELFLNENPFSSTLGRVAWSGVPAACLINSRRIGELHDQAPAGLVALALELERRRLGSVFPYRVLPLDFRAELDALGLFRDNRFARTFEELELWGGQPTRERLWQLVWDEAERARLRAHQHAYRRAVEALPGPRAVLEGAVP